MRHIAGKLMRQGLVQKFTFFGTFLEEACVGVILAMIDMVDANADGDFNCG